MEATIGLSALALVAGFPVLLLAGMWLLGWLETWMVQPDERAAVVRRLLDEIEEAADIERAVAMLLAEVADPVPPGGTGGYESIESKVRSMLPG